MAVAFTEAARRYYPHTRALAHIRPRTPLTVVVELPYYAEMAEFAGKLRTYRISPFGWCAFSVEAWVEHGRRRISPSPRWVFSLKRIESRADWYAWEQSKWAGGRLYMSPSHRDLYRLYEQMRSAILREPELDDAVVQRVVQRVLPPSLYRKLEARAKAETEFKQAELDDALRRGEFVW
jgi:hypothetical protein